MDTNRGQTNGAEPQKAPVKAGWICLGIAWGLFIIPIPGIGIIGWALNLAAFIISVIVMVKDRVGAGVAQMVCSLVVSPVIYLIGLGILGHFLFPAPRIHNLFI